MMRLLFLSIIFATCTTSEADESRANLRTAPYIYCNVTLPDACFGIAAGDKLTMEIVIDFVLYKVKFASGGSATIYYGFNPSSSDKRGTDFIACSGMNGFGVCKKRTLKNGDMELIAARDGRSEALHIIVAGDSKDQEIPNSFINNIRACKQTDSTISCAP